ncbi:MAG: TIR domain-containing protein, partial [Endozoicomonadaceae bacterium]|nr:TIR domain-containing protein [Endozoicomonadaceae bacterium]
MKKIKIFLSYSHEDDNAFTEILKHFKSLETIMDVEIYCDKFNDGGAIIWDEIFNNLKESDILCPIISVNYMNSEGCEKEREKVLRLSEDNPQISIIPIILEDCEWSGIPELSKRQAFPNDGKPVCDANGKILKDKAKEITSGLRKKIEKTQKLIKDKKVSLTDEFADELQDLGVFARVFPRGKKFKLKDLFVERTLSKYERVRDNADDAKRINSADLINHKKILIAGDVQSGKTTLCKELFGQYLKKGLVPVYISVPNDPTLPGLIENRIQDKYIEQYGNKSAKFDVIKGKVVPIIDDFHKANNKEKHIQHLSEYENSLVIVDDIFALNLRDEKLVQSYIHFKLHEMNETQKVSLIRKLLNVMNEESHDELISPVANYKEEDESIEVVDSFLGRGVAPA